MILYQCVNPLDNSVYTFSTKQIHLSAANDFRASLNTVWGAHGVLDANAGLDDPKNAVNVTYQFRLLPRDAGRKRDDMVREFHKAVAHGYPQSLLFRDDSGVFWVGSGKAVGLPTDVTPQGKYAADLQMTWRMNSPFLRTLDVQHDLLWGDAHADGTAVLWGEPGLVWGQSSTTFTLDAASKDFVISNPQGTVVVANIALSIQVPAGKNYGPVLTTDGGGNPILPDPYGTNPAGIRLVNNSFKIGGVPVETRILNTLRAGEGASVDFAHRTAVTRGVGAWRYVWRPAVQRGFFALKPDTNSFTVSIVGTPASSLGALLTLSWYPLALVQ